MRENPKVSEGSDWSNNSGQDQAGADNQPNRTLIIQCAIKIEENPSRTEDPVTKLHRFAL